jgi:ribosomal protein S18 acetylase RimI-like enzyme
LTLRPADRADREAAARLILEPTGGLGRILPDRAQALRAARGAFLAERSALSFRRSVVAVRGDEILGLIVRFPGSEWPSLRTATGLAMLRAAGPRAAYRLVVEGRREERLLPSIAPDELYVMSLAVLPLERSKGVGALLLARAGDEARALGLRAVSLDVDAGSEAAVRFYLGEGFAAVGRRHERRRGPRLASIRMRRPVG